MPAHEVLRLFESAASKVRDPLTGQSLKQAGMVGPLRLEDGRLIVQLIVSPKHDDAQRRRMLGSLGREIKHAGWDGPIDAELQELPDFDPGPEASACSTAQPEPPTRPSPAKDEPGLPAKKPIPGVKHVVAVASGKGGVGKSSVALQLALALQRAGHSVGVMDADIYGPSLPLMLGVSERPGLNDDKKIVPVQAHGLKCMSVGFLIGEKTPLIWRGPMVMGVVRQFIEDVDWSGLDYLVIDLPPGTGDAQLTMAQIVPVSGAVIVSTPQQLALLDVVRGIEMFQQLHMPILGVVENMAWLELPDGSRIHPFGEGGAAALATERGVPLLAQLPLDPALREAGDRGEPALDPAGATAQAFDSMAGAVHGALVQA
jgi:ATP-binding protein involved in chromosome partitioning